MLGDVLWAEPIVRARKKKEPESEIHFLTAPPHDLLFMNNSDLAGVNDLAPEYLVDEKTQLFYEFQPDRHILAGYSESAGLPFVEQDPRIILTPREVDRGREILAGLNLEQGPLIGLHPGVTWPERTWEWFKWDGLARELSTGFKANILVLGKTPDFTLPPWPGVHNLIDKLSIRELLSIIKRLDLFVGLDSGLMHLAAALRVPVTALFGCISPDWRKPFSTVFSPVTADVPCLGCQARRPAPSFTGECEDGSLRCMKEIQVEGVIKAVQRTFLAAGVDLEKKACEPKFQASLPRKGVNWELLAAASGSPTLRVQDNDRMITLHSAHDPVIEAQRLISGISPEQDVVALGLGLGYHIKALLKQPGRTGKVIVVEEENEIFKASLSGGVMTDSWNDPGLFLIVGQSPGLAAMRIKSLQLSPDRQIIVLRASMRLSPNYYGAMEEWLNKEAL